MAPRKACAPKRSGNDPELSQLLRLVLEKLGREEAGEVMGAPVHVAGGVKSSRPKRSHVAPSAAFPPVKRTRRGGAQPPVSPSLPPTVAAPTAAASPSVHIDLPEPPAPIAAPSPVTQGTTPVLGLEGVLADIRKSLASLAPAAQAGAPPAPLTGIALPAAVATALPVPPPASKAPELLAPVQDPSRQTLLEVSRLLASISTPPVNSPPPTTPWVAEDSLQNTLNELKRQVDALSAAHTTNSQVSVLSQSITLTPGAVVASPPIVQNVQPGPSKAPVQDNSTKEGTSDAVLSRPGKLTAHVAAEVKEKIWKGEFVDIFSLIRAKRREVEPKDKEPKSTFFGERKPRVEESITNWLLGFNVFMSVWLEKKPELASSLIYYANKILKAQHTYGGYAWLEYDRDFRWARVEDPSIGWDQTEVEVWLECVNNKVAGRQPFRTQAHSERKGSCWAFNRNGCSRPAGSCKFRHNCSFCGHPSHPETKCIKKSKERGRDSSKPAN
ncbi:hypothetical protein NDU88_001018 [Pleurodeles waltl]|uniref:C3H1-type domain-containing protein n=1 Tax=Pleurodeles waltl TaxID=8319 RepID=A0AAV7M1W0_PLEWA|nr:hypothetical protein NDU88_001018 [Pleurodeles waltl]